MIRENKETKLEVLQFYYSFATTSNFVLKIQKQWDTTNCKVEDFSLVKCKFYVIDKQIRYGY